MTLYTNSIFTENIQAIGHSAPTTTVSGPVTLTGSTSLYLLDVTGADQLVTLPSDVNSTKGQLIEIIVLSTSLFSALIPQTNTNLPFEGTVDPGQRISFLYDGTQWCGGKTVSADTEFGWGRTATYRGNAGSGTYLQWVFSGGSDDYPYLIPNDATIHAVTIVAGATTTVTVGFYTWDGVVETLVGNVTMIADITYSNVLLDWDVTFGAQLRVKVDSGTISKPVVETYFRQR